MVYEDMIVQLQTGTTGFVGNLLNGVVAFFIFAILMFVGIFVADLLGKALRMFLEKIKLEKYLKSHEVDDAFVGFTLSDITVSLLKLYVVVAFLAIAADVVRVPVLTFLATQAVGYLPSLVQGLIVLLAFLVAGDYITDHIKKSKTIPFANTFGIIVEVFIAYNALVIAMPMLLPAADPSLLVWSFLVVLTAAAFAIGLGFAIAIGLGTKDVVAEVAKKHKDKLHRFM